MSRSVSDAKQASRGSRVQLQAPPSEDAGLHQSVVGRSDSVRSLHRSGSVTGSRSKLKERSGSSTLLRRLEVARRRADAAIMIQRSWHRWYVSAARRRRVKAVIVIQRAWGSRLLLANAKRELKFLRWLRARRAHLRGQWHRVAMRLQQRETWALVTIAAFKNRCVWRHRLVRRRRNRYAAKIQRWWRQLLYNRRTWRDVLWSVEFKETLRLELAFRRNIMSQARSMFDCVTAEAQEQYDATLVDRLEQWYEQHRLPLEVSPRLKRAAERRREIATAQDAVVGAAEVTSSASETAPWSHPFTQRPLSASPVNPLPSSQPVKMSKLVAIPPAAPLAAAVPQHVQLRRVLASQCLEVAQSRCSSARGLATARCFAVHVRPPSASMRGRDRARVRCPEDEI